jgi:hypothetical protein
MMNIPDAMAGQKAPGILRRIAYDNSNTGAGCRRGLVRFLPNHGLGELIGDQLKWWAAFACIHLEPIICEFVAARMSRE